MEEDINKIYNEGDLANENTVERKKAEAQETYDEATNAASPVDDFDFEADNARLATLPRQQEWEAYVARFQGCDPDAPSTGKWKRMEQIFQLEK